MILDWNLEPSGYVGLGGFAWVEPLVFLPGVVALGGNYDNVVELTGSF
jgi:hypothetical protein